MTEGQRGDAVLTEIAASDGPVSFFSMDPSTSAGGISTRAPGREGDIPLLRCCSPDAPWDVPPLVDEEPIGSAFCSLGELVPAFWEDIVDWLCGEEEGRIRVVVVGIYPARLARVRVSA